MSAVFDYIAPLANKDGLTVERRGSCAILSNTSGSVPIILNGLEHLQDYKANFEMLALSRYNHAKRALEANA